MHSATGDWTLECHYDYSPYGLPGPPQYLLSIRLTTAQTQQLLNEGAVRGCPSFRLCIGDGDNRLYAKGIELTQAEALAISGGASPLDVLFPVWADCGYRLVAVTDPLLG